MVLTTNLKHGGKYNWKNQPERLVYMGSRRYPGDNRLWYQFAKVETPNKCWSEVLANDLLHFEETKVATEPAGATDAVAYLDIGEGYTDIGTDLTDAELARLPKGRHALAIAGTSKIDNVAATTTHAEAVKALLAHISDVMSDEEFAKIDTAMWNAVSVPFMPEE